MKIFIKILCVVLVFSMLATTFVACQKPDEGGEEETTTKRTTAQTEESGYVSQIEQKKYDREFVVYHDGSTVRPEYYFAQEKYDAKNTMAAAVATRDARVKEQLGVTVKAVQHEDYRTYANNVINSVAAGDGAYQLVLSHCYVGVLSIVTQKAATNFDELTDIIRLDEDHWNKTQMDQVMVEDCRYLGYGSYQLAFTYVIAFNKKLRETNRIENLYELVEGEDGKKAWTLDKMIEVAGQCNKNVGATSWGTEDTYGFTGYCWVPFCDFLASSGIDIVTKNAVDEYEINMDAEKCNNLVQKLIDFCKSTCVYTWDYTTVGDPSKQVQMKDGNTLLQVMDILSLINLTAYDIEFGVLPYPLYDENQKEYRSLNWNGYMIIPAKQGEADTQMCAETIELLCGYSTPVKEVFYEKLLGSKVSGEENDVKMLDIIWDSIVFDPVLAFDSGTSIPFDNMLYTVPQCILQNKSFTTWYQANVKSANTYLQKSLGYT